MRVTQVNHASHDIEEKLTAEFRSIRVNVGGVNVTLIERERGVVDIQVDPTNEPYMHKIRFAEAVLHDSQLRIAGAHGSAL